MHRIAATLSLIGGLTLAGCQTPDLQPFADATGSVTASLTQGGALAINAVGTEPMAAADGSLVARDSPDHPVAQLRREWDARRKTADALLAYSAALAAIGDASHNRKANATAVFDSVKKLAETVPGLSLGTDATGNLVVSALGTFAEVKAWRKMSEAVKNSDPAIQIIAGAIRRDLGAMANLHKGVITARIGQSGGSEFRKLLRLEAKLKAERDARRTAVEADAANAAAADELLRLEALLAPVEREANARRATTASWYAAIEQGEAFYATAIAAVDAWAQAHADLAAAFSEKRSPNIGLLLARAQELELQLQDWRASRRNPDSP